MAKVKIRQPRKKKQGCKSPQKMPRTFIAFGSAKDDVTDLHISLWEVDGTTPVSPAAYVSRWLEIVGLGHDDNPHKPNPEHWDKFWVAIVKVIDDNVAGDKDYILMVQGFNARLNSIGQDTSVFTLKPARQVERPLVPVIDFPDADNYYIEDDERDNFVPFGETDDWPNGAGVTIQDEPPATIADWDNSGTWWAIFSGLTPGNSKSLVATNGTGPSAARIVYIV
jgi:hypothetical protein